MGRKTYRLLTFILFACIISISANAQEHPPLYQAELDKFITDTPTFITKVKEIQLDFLLIKLFLHPTRIHEDPEIVDILNEIHWKPDRYAYIFSRVIIGGFIRDMGGFGDEDLAFLKTQRQKWQDSSEPEEEKKDMIAQLDRAIADLSEIVARTKAIPKKELVLMWNNRDQLNDVLMGKLPIGKKVMRALP